MHITLKGVAIITVSLVVASGIGFIVLPIVYVFGRCNLSSSRANRAIPGLTRQLSSLDIVVSGDTGTPHSSVSGDCIDMDGYTAQAYVTYDLGQISLGTTQRSISSQLTNKGYKQTLPLTINDLTQAQGAYYENEEYTNDSKQSVSVNYTVTLDPAVECSFEMSGNECDSLVKTRLSDKTKVMVKSVSIYASKKFYNQ